MAGLRAALAGLETGVLGRFLQSQRWFGAKGRRLRGVDVHDLVPLDGDDDALGIARLDAAWDDGASATFQLPLALRDVPPADARAVVAEVADGALLDAVFDAGFRRLLGRAVAEGARVSAGDVTWSVTPIEPGRRPPAAEARLMGVEQSNTSLAYGEELIVKLFRRLEVGENPDVEIGEFLTRHTHFRHVPALLATAAFDDAGGARSVAGMAQRFVASVGDGWSWALGRLEAWLAARPGTPDYFPAAATHLGRVTRGLHEALASRPDLPAFAPEPIGAADARRWTARVAATVERSLGRLEQALPVLDGALGAEARALVGRGPEAQGAIRRLGTALETEGGMRIRHHGDYHLGQVLRTRDDDFVIIDFEGEPARPLTERRAKHSPLRDVAGMLRSFDYAAAVGSRLVPERSGGWAERAREAFLEGYLETEDGSGVPFLPPGHEASARAVRFFEVEKVFYELAYELGNRPEWVGIPLAGARRLLDALGGEA